jgi:hypothetical protein
VTPVAADDDFDSFRSTLAPLDAETEQRVRRRFEALRHRGRAPSMTPHEPGHDEQVVELTPSISTTVDALPRHTRRVLLGVAAALVLVALIGLVALVRNADDAAEVASGVDDVPLTELAARAVNRPDADLAPGTYLHRILTEGSTVAAAGDYAPGFQFGRTEQWLSSDGLGLNRQLEQRFVPSGPGDPPFTDSTAVRDQPVEVEQYFLNSTLYYDDIRDLPPDSQALIDAIRVRLSGSGDDVVAEVVAAILALDTTPPAVRAAGFDALALLGARPVGPVTTYGGAQGAGYRASRPDGGAWLLVVDPRTTRVLAFARGVGEGERAWSDAEWFSEFGEQDVTETLPS